MTHLECKRPVVGGVGVVGVVGVGHDEPYRPTHINTQPKKPKASRRKKKRDPNEPQKPVSAYALFFRDSQASIKGRNPNLSFGDVSKMVASLWDSLDSESKALYKKRTEMAKKEYLRQLASYREVSCFNFYPSIMHLYIVNNINHNVESNISNLKLMYISVNTILKKSKKSKNDL